MRDDARSAEARRTAQQLIDSSKRRLAQWNVTPAQITDLERTASPGEFLTLLSPFRGIVEAVPVDQGRNVRMGDHLVDVADLSSVWVWADVYENELSSFRLGQKVKLTTAAYPGQEFEGTISLINPFLDAAQRTGKVRIDIPNPDFRLRPAMYVSAVLTAGGSREALTIPVGAVMPTGTRNIVFVDKTEGRLEPRAVSLGEKYGDRYEVKDGLSRRRAGRCQCQLPDRRRGQGAGCAQELRGTGGHEQQPGGETMIERLIEWSARNRFLVVIFTLFAVAGGIYALQRTPLDAIPGFERRAGDRLYRLGRPFARSGGGPDHLSDLHQVHRRAESKIRARRVDVRQELRVRHLRGRHGHLLGALARGRIPQRRARQPAGRRQSRHRPGCDGRRLGVSSTRWWTTPASTTWPNCVPFRTGTCAMRWSR